MHTDKNVRARFTVIHVCKQKNGTCTWMNTGSENQSVSIEIWHFTDILAYKHQMHDNAGKKDEKYFKKPFITERANHPY